MSDNDKPTKCKYISTVGNICPRYAMRESIYCFWHDPKADKTGSNIKSQIEKFFKQGEPLEGFQLKHANLSGIKLASSKFHTNFSNANLYRVNFEGAHLYNVNFSRANLMKTNCNNANLNFAIMRDANLLGIHLHDAKIDHIEWGAGVEQELFGYKKRRKGETKLAKEYFQEAEETYRLMFREYEERGIYEEAGKFFQKEMLMRRMQLKPFSKDWCVNVFSDVVTGYGEEPLKAFMCSFVIVILGAVLFAFLGIDVNGELQQLSLDKGFSDNLYCLFQALYFSVVTFTTLGYGDISPTSILTKLIAMTEAFVGSFILAIYVVIVVKKMAR